jgi:PIN domain nuclease of toxin-antitoxin system
MSASATALLIDPANEWFLSVATVWEIAIKMGLKKLALSAPFLTFMTRALTGYGITLLPMTLEDMATSSSRTMRPTFTQSVASPSSRHLCRKSFAAATKTTRRKIAPAYCRIRD